jgi:hypothetical protein
MTFLQRYGYSAVGLNFVLSCCAFLWNVLVSGDAVDAVQCSGVS